MYTQIVLAEVVTGYCAIRSLTEFGRTSVTNSFKMPPNAEEVISELKSLGSGAAPPVLQPLHAVSSWSRGSEGFGPFGITCNNGLKLFWSDVIPIYRSIGSSTALSSKPLESALLLPDCPAVISGLGGLNPSTVAQTTRLACAHLVDLGRFASIAFNCAPLNICDIGANAQRYIPTMRIFLPTGAFAVGFLIRKECKMATPPIRPGIRGIAEDRGQWGFVNIIL